jgi:hypothetical protein
MHDLAGFDSALRAASDFLGQIFRKIGEVIEMEVGTANRAVCVFSKYVLCVSKKLGELCHWSGLFSSRLNIFDLIHGFSLHFVLLVGLQCGCGHCELCRLT